MRLITLLMLSVVLIGCEKELPVFKGTPLERDGLFYAPNSTEPLTADVEEYYESGALKGTFSLLAGAKQGLEQSWSKNGQLLAELTFLDGKHHGVAQRWTESGRLYRKGTYLHGEAEGLVQEWWLSDGHSEICYKAGEKTDMSYCTEGKQP
jgi:antitoxin component YwqK of YwqJK toxin-antitoxin module